MRTETNEIYKINELSPEAQQKAHDNYLYREGFEFFWVDEMIDSLKGFCDLFDVTIKDYSFSDNMVDISYRFDVDDNIANLSGIRLSKYLWNNYGFKLFRPRQVWYTNKRKNTVGQNSKVIKTPYMLEQTECPFTGVCHDMDLLDPIYEQLNKFENITFSDLIRECIHSFERSCLADLQSQTTLEYFIDHAEANEYEYTSNGTRY